MKKPKKKLINLKLIDVKNDLIEIKSESTTRQSIESPSISSRITQHWS